MEQTTYQITSLLKESQLKYFSFMDFIQFKTNEIYKNEINRGGYLMILPLKQALILTLNGFNWRIEENQSFVYYLEPNQEFMIEGSSSLENSELIVGFIHQPYTVLNQSLKMKPIMGLNKLYSIIRTANFNVFLGKYEWNRKDELPLKNKTKFWWCSSILGNCIIDEHYVEESNSILFKHDQLIKFSSITEEGLFLAIDFTNSNQI